MSDNRGRLLRSAPEPPTRSFTPEEAVDAARAEFNAARRAQIDLLGGTLSQLLFDQSTVNYRRLRSLRYEARAQVERAMQVEHLLTKAIEAMESVR